MAASTTKTDEIRKRHKPTEWRGYEWCSVCSAPYPCDAAILMEQIDDHNILGEHNEH